ncbi:ABC transporter substrate-binding protein [Reyranella sp.]|jgi:putative ABC transport system substrate-binding protein|uniref:ABC transporter substrate-binding protein n=1 Tax=Reyranella sp. TaxID=1929291 RepID=UPI002F91EB32
MISRRHLLRGLGLAMAWSDARAAPAPSTPRRIGFLSRSVGLSRPVYRTFHAALADLGYVEGRDIVVENYVGESMESLAAVAARAAGAGVEIIVADGGAAAQAARNATRAIPIVAIMGVDPVDRGWSASLARPDGNLTGVTTYGLEVGAKQLELLLEIVPSARHVALLFSGQAPITLRTLREACRRAGVDAQEVVFTGRAEGERVLTAAAAQGVDGIIVLADPLTGELLDQVVNFANSSRRPAIYAEREYVEAGGLISYGINMAGIFRHAAGFVDRVLRGASPADLPIERPTKLELIINLRTARALGLALPTTLLARADEVIE